MAEVTNGAPSTPAGVVQPSAAPPAGVSQPAPQQQGPKRLRISEMAEGLEQANALADRRAQETERRLARPDPAQTSPEGASQTPEPELDALPEAEPESDLLEPEQPADAQQQAAQEQDQKLLDATKAWLEGRGDMPEQIRNQIHEWTDKTSGAPRRMTIAQMEEGVLRQSDYQRNMNELRGYHQQVQFREQAAQRLEQAFRDPEQLFVELQNRDPAVFHQVSVKYANLRLQMKRVAEGAGYALMQQYGYQANHPDVVNAVRASMQAQEQAQRTDIENRRLREHNQMLAQMRQQQDQQQSQQVRLGELKASIAPIMPTALKAAGVRNTAKNQESFWQHLAAHVTNLPNWDGNVRRQHCIEAAKMVREELEDLEFARRPKKPPQQSRAMSPTKLGASGSAQPTTPERKRISDMQNDPRFGFGVV